MKKAIVSIFFWLQFVSIFSQEDCIGNSPLQPCCNDIISTGFPNPTNSEYPALENQFDWLKITAQPGNSNSISHNYNGNLTQIIHPLLNENTKFSWFSNYSFGVNFDADAHNMHPRYGWELMHMNFGLGLFNTATPQTGGGIYGTYLMFYNKYNGKVRILASPQSGSSKSNEISVDLSIPVHPLSSNEYHSATFNSYNVKQLALDNKSPITKVQSQMNNTTPKDWTLTDFELSYDPCICYYRSWFVFRFTERNFSYANISSKLIGNYQPLTDYSGRISSNYLLHSIWQTDLFLNERIHSGLVTVNQKSYGGNTNYIALAELIDIASKSKEGFLMPLPLVIRENIPQFNNQDISVGLFLNHMLRYGSKSTTNPLPYLVMSEMDAQYDGFVRYQANSGSFGTINLNQPGSYHPYRLSVPWTTHPFYNEATGLFAILETPTVDFVAKRNTRNDLQSQLILSASEPIQFALNPAAEIDLEKTKIYASLQFDLFQDPQYELEACCATDIENAFFISDTRLPNTMYENAIETFAPTFNILEAESTGKRTIHTALVPIDKLHEFLFKLEKNHISFLEPSSGKPLNMQLNIIADYTFLPNKYNEVNKTLQVYTYHVETNNLTPRGAVEYSCINSSGKLCNKYNFTTINQGYERDVYLSDNIFSQDTTIVGRNVFIAGNLSTENNAQVTIFALEDIQLQQANIAHEINFEIKNILESESVNPVSDAVVKDFCNSNKYQARYAAVSSLPDENETSINFPIEFSLYPNPTNSALFFDISANDDVTFSAQLFDVMGKKYNQYASNESLKKGFHKKQYDLSSLSKGVYFFRFCFDNNCKTEKVIVVR